MIPWRGLVGAVLGVAILAVSIRPAGAQSSCLDYLDHLGDTLAQVEAAYEDADLGDVGTLTRLYVRFYTLRHEYEEMDYIPACVLDLHVLVIAYLGGQNDLLGLSLAWYADPANRESYTAQIAPIEERNTAVRVVLQTELNRIQAELNVTPAPTLSALPIPPSPQSTPDALSILSTVATGAARQ